MERLGAFPCAGIEGYSEPDHLYHIWTIDEIGKQITSVEFLSPSGLEMKRMSGSDIIDTHSHTHCFDCMAHVIGQDLEAYLAQKLARAEEADRKIVEDAVEQFRSYLERNHGS